MADALSAQVEFGDYLAANQALGADGTSGDVDRPFTTHPMLMTYWTNPRIRQALGAHYSHQHLNTIRHGYLRIFSTLVIIGQPQWINQMVQYPTLADVRLPFCPSTSRPHNWPIGADWSVFYKAQWQFCALPFERAFLLSGPHLEVDQILPIVEKTLLGESDSSKTFRTKLHDQLNLLKNPFDRGGSIASEFVIKTYYTEDEDAKQSYINEVGAYQRLAQRKSAERNVIHFYGSWRQGKTYNILLEYADKGSLLDYYRNTPPPTQSRDIASFWKNMLAIGDAIHQIHSLSLVEDGPFPFQGIHQDIKPANILVVSGEEDSQYEVVFKLADFGRSHFKPVPQNQREVESADSYGNLMYSAPECCRIDQNLQHTELSVTSKIDIWSWGCVLSESATWVVLGEHGRNEYAASRRAQTDCIPHLHRAGYSGCFHNGTRALQAVYEMHTRLVAERRLSDNKLESIILLIERMLEHETPRHNAIDVYKQIRWILREEENPNFSSSLRVDKATPPQLPSGPIYSAPTPGTLRQKPPQTPAQPPLGAIGLNIHNNNIENSFKGNTSPTPELSFSPSPRNPSFSENLSGLNSPQSSLTHILMTPSNPKIPNGHPYLKHDSPTYSVTPERTLSTHNRQHTMYGNEYGSPSTPPVLPIRSPTNRTTQESSQNIYIQDILEWSEKYKGGKFPAVLETIIGRLWGRDHVFLIDDSESMKPSWPSVIRVFRGLAWVVKRADPDGIDLYFTTDAKPYNRKHRKDLVSLIENKKPAGQCDMKFALGNIVREFKPRLKGISEKPVTRNRLSRSLSLLSPTAVSKSAEKRGLSIYVLTNGIWQTDSAERVCGVEQPVRQLINKLKTNEQLDTDVAIQFIRFGNDENGIQRLEILDSRLQEFFPDIDWDIVDTTAYNDDVVQMLLGALERSRDRGNDKATTPISPYQS